MVSRVVFALLTLAGSSLAAIDFAPHPLVVELEGIKSTQPSFRDGDQAVTFTPPEKWSVDGAGSVLQIKPPASSSFARVETRPLPVFSAGSDDWVKAVRNSLIALLPPEAQGLTWVPEIEKNPVLFNRHETWRLEATYTVLGQSFHVTLLVCHLEKQQLLMTLGARERDFASLYETWRRSLFTWQGLR